MPTTTGKFQLQDFDKALIARGFEMFEQAERYQMVNLGYRYVARQFPFTWTQTVKSYALTNGATLPLDVGSGDPLTENSIKLVYLIDSGNRYKVEVDNYQHFTETWLSTDLSDTTHWSKPDHYFVYAGSLYLLPPPAGPCTVEVHFHQYLLDLTAVTDVTAVPQVFDEVILDAALVRCHRRTHELQLASEAQLRVDGAIEEMLASDIFQMEELQERVRADDTWL